MTTIPELLWHVLRDAFLMAWEVWWALVLGFAISALVQAWVPRERVQASLGGEGVRPTVRATLLGAASSSCSYAAVAIAKSLFEKGASALSALAFQFASTNLVWELGLVLWVLLGWQFTLAEYLGGVVMIALMGLGLRLFVSRQVEADARAHALSADAGHHHDHGSPTALPWRARLRSTAAWSEVAGNFLGDWSMLWKEIGIGFLLAGLAAQLPEHFFQSLFVSHAPAPVPALEGAVVGPLIAVLSFVCSVGNVPLAAVLWAGQISFAGVLSFLFADLIVLPILAIYRKYYGRAFALRITALMFVAMVVAALLVSAGFELAGLSPSGPRPTRAAIFASIRVDYKLVLNVAAAAVFVILIWLSRAGGERRASGCHHAAVGGLRS